MGRYLAGLATSPSIGRLQGDFPDARLFQGEDTVAVGIGLGMAFQVFCEPLCILGEKKRRQRGENGDGQECFQRKRKMLGGRESWKVMRLGSRDGNLDRFDCIAAASVAGVCETSYATGRYPGSV